MRWFVLATLALLLLPACDPKPRPVRVLVVGLDGADWDVIDPLAAAGYLPTIGGLVEDGLRADLDCVPALPQFACFCPPVWTSIMTGQPAHVHHMIAIQSRADERGAPALWTLNGQRGGVNTLVSIRNSWPFEAEVNWGLSEPGLDAMAAEVFKVWGGGNEHPALEEPETLSVPSRLFEILGIRPRAGPDAWTAFARDRVAMEAMSGLGLLTRFTSLLLRSSELVVLTLHSPDKSSHVAWGSIQALPEAPIDEDALLAQAEAWQGPVTGPAPWAFGSVASQYLEAEQWLGEYLERNRYDYVVLASDHGMARNPGPGLAGVHGSATPEAHWGILSITGAGVRAGVEVEANVLDVAPTLAYLMGIPVAEDLPGRVLVEGMTDEKLASDPIQTIPSW